MTRFPAISSCALGVALALSFVAGGCAEDDAATAVGDAAETRTSATYESTTGNADGSTGADERDNGTDGAGGGNDVSEWCGYVSDVLASSAFSLDGLFQLPPADLEARLTANAGVTKEGVAASTDDIGPWVTIIDEAMQAAVVAGQEADWDIMAMSENPIFFDQMTLNNLLIASEEIDFYNTETCGLPTNLSGQNSDAMPDASSDAVPDSSGDETGQSDLGAQPIGLEKATSGGTATAGSVGVGTDVPGGSGADVVEWFVAQMGVPPSTFPEQAWECVANEIDLAFPNGVAPGPLDPELQAVVTGSLSGCGFG